MSTPHTPQPVKLILSVLYRDDVDFQRVLEIVQTKFGSPDFLERKIPFTFTTYYEPEMGAPLYRAFLSFEKCILPDQLVEIKLWTNQLEKEFLNPTGKRQLNLDPGYLNGAQVILATGKNFSHRVYLNSGIFADLTLVYVKEGYQALPWTYPDYQAEPLKSILLTIRKTYLRQMNERKN